MMQKPFKHTLRLWMITFLFILNGTGEAFAQLEVSNTRWVVREMVQQVDSILTTHNIKSFYIDIKAPESVVALIKAELLLKKYVLFDIQNDNTSIQKLSIEPILNVSYQKTSRKEALRTLKGNLSIQIVNSEGILEVSEVVGLFHTQKIRGDHRTFEDNMWEMSRFKEVINTRRSEQFKRVLEPALIISSIAVTVFLLFNVRTQ
jgi:hypothetical protein